MDDTILGMSLDVILAMFSICSNICYLNIWWYETQHQIMSLRQALGDSLLKSSKIQDVATLGTNKVPSVILDFLI